MPRAAARLPADRQLFAKESRAALYYRGAVTG